MKKVLFAIVTFTIISFSTDIIAQSIITDRPDMTESAFTVPVSSLQIETGFGIGFETVDKKKYQKWSGPSTLFRVGILKNLELRVTSQLENVKIKDKDYSLTGISDMQIGGKVKIFKSKNEKTDIAFLSHLLVPTGSSDLTNDSYGTINRLAVSHVLSENISMGYNLGYDYFGEGSGDFVYTLAFGFSLTEKLGVFVEGFGVVEDFSDNYSNFDAGFTYLIRNNLQYDFSFGTGINLYMNYISTGISWNIGGYKSN